MTYTNVNQDAVFAALGDPTRREIIEHLRAGPSAVGPLATVMPISRPAVSQHLKVLSDAGLLDVEQIGTRRIYRLSPQGITELRNYLDRLWGDALSSFAEYAERNVKES